jgi:hypothetical protein
MLSLDRKAQSFAQLRRSFILGRHSEEQRRHSLEPLHQS